MTPSSVFSFLPVSEEGMIIVCAGKAGRFLLGSADLAKLTGCTIYRIGIAGLKAWILVKGLSV
jgi:hypothetical protein